MNIFLNENNIQSREIHADMNHEKRLQLYQDFKEGLYNIICCTDIASRGLDCTHVKFLLH